MNGRIAAVIAFAALVAGGATLFGAALAAEGHGDAESATHVEEEDHADEGVEPGGAEAGRPSKVKMKGTLFSRSSQRS
jgi:hypothetical protein